MDASDPKVVERAQPTPKRGSIEGWPLRWKVAAIMVLPVLLAATFGALRIQSELTAASKLSIASSNAVIVVPAVELVNRVDGLGTAAASGQSVTQPLTQFDASATTLDSLLNSAEFPSTVAAELGTASSTAKVLREEIASGPVPPVRIADQTQSVASGMASAIATSMASVDDVSVRRLADRLVTVLAAQRALTAQQVLVAAPDFDESIELRSRAAEAAGAEAAVIDRLTQLTSTQETSGLQQASNLRRAAYTRPLDAPVFTTQFTGAMRADADEYHAMAQQLSSDLDATVRAKANELRSAALRDTAIFLGAVLAALVFALGVGRSLIRSIGRLRRGAVEVAQVQLPEEIDRLSKGAGLPEITPLPVHTKEEVGQLARAIDDIHSQAVRLASEHGVRLQIGEMFETLSRRSRSLVEEQLALIETLESDEDDPARLDHLFRLDHLVTRMRRNGDNLLVLADTVERHRRAEPVQLHEVLRAAMSEVEDYHRVTLGSTVDGAIVGAAAGDVGHLIAEVLDNALRYSPPDSSVLITASRAVDAGILVEVADRGLGMSQDELRAANESLAVGGEVTPETAKRMGLFVVGRLARRHEATVRLRATDPLTDHPGVTASVHLPGALLAPPSGIAGALDGSGAEIAGESAFRVIENGRASSRGGLTVVGNVPGSVDAEESTDEPDEATSGSDLPVRKGNKLPKRSPGASGVNAAAPPDDQPTTEDPAPQATSNPFAYFTNRTAPEDAQGQEEPTPPTPVHSDGAPIYERMMSEWMTDPTTRAANGGAWATPADEGWAVAEEAVERKPQRHTDSGLPIRERGARLVPGQAKGDVDTDAGPDPDAVRSMLSRALAGVRTGRDEASQRPDEPKETDD